MGAGPMISFRGRTPVWEKPEFLKLAVEAVWEFWILTGNSVTMRFDWSAEGDGHHKLWAEVAWSNVVFAALKPAETGVGAIVCRSRLSLMSQGKLVEHASDAAHALQTCLRELAKGLEQLADKYHKHGARELATKIKEALTG